MPAQLVTSPDPHALTKGGRMVFQFQGSGRNITTGSVAVSVLFFAKAVADGEVLTLKWNGRARSITFKTSPTSPGEFPAGDGSSAYVDALLPKLAAYFPFYKDFKVTRYDTTQLPGIVFTARQAGAAFNILEPSFPVGTPFGFGRTTDGADPKVRTRYSIYTELWLQRFGTTGDDKADFDLVFSAPIETSTQGLALFDAGNILHAELAPDRPNWNVNQARQSLSSHRKYFVGYGEAWGSPIEVSSITHDEIRDVYLGGADYVNRSGVGFSLAGYLQKESAEKDSALRFGSKTRYVRHDEPQFLSFLNTRASAQAKLRVTLKYDNNATQTYSDLIEEFSYGKNQKWTLPAGVTQLGLLDKVPVGRTLVEYELRLTTAGLEPGQGAHLSAPYRYVLNANYQPYTRYFAYLSSLGVVDTLTTFGKGSSELTRFFEQASKFSSAFYKIEDGQFVDYDLSLQEQIEVSTGFRNRLDLQHLNDFYRSPERFHLTERRALPISISNKSIKTVRDGDTTFAHTFQFVYLFRNDFYTYSGEDDGDDLPPPGFAPMGNVTLVHNEVVDSIDRTIDDSVRALTASDVHSFVLAAARPNPLSLGFLTEGTGRLVFRPLDKKIDYQLELKNKPTTRNDAGLSDVPTVNETEEMISKLGGVRATLTSWTTPSEPTV